jgi:hypothetical protein
LRIQGLGEGESEVSTFELPSAVRRTWGIDTRAISVQHETLAKGNAVVTALEMVGRELLGRSP